MDPLKKHRIDIKFLRKSNGTLKNRARPSRDCPEWIRIRSQRKRISKVSEYAPCKTKKPRAEIQQHKKLVNFMEGGSVSLANLKKDHAGKLKIK